MNVVAAGAEDKLRIVAEAEQPGASFAAVARRYEISRGLLWNWRQQVRRGALMLDPTPIFVPVQITPDPPFMPPFRAPLRSPRQRRKPGLRSRYRTAHVFVWARVSVWRIAPDHVRAASVIVRLSAARLAGDRPYGHAARHERFGLCRFSRRLQRDPHAGYSTFSAARGASTRHSTYSLRQATIAYRWHPLAGQTLQVSPHRRGKDLTCIYTAERPGFSRELPNWMFDQAYCAGMTLGAPQISLEGLD